ncbi:hypothetical protein [Deinococcus sp. PEB2-63]
MRQPITALMRTPAEVHDLALSWGRADLPFFAAGACHVLAFAFLERYPQAGFRPRFIRPAPGFRGAHVYVTDGQLAFDAQGFVPEAELLRLHMLALRSMQPGWQGEVQEIGVPLAEFCAGQQHRPPWAYPGDVWARAQRYLNLFPDPATVAGDAQTPPDRLA